MHLLRATSWWLAIVPLAHALASDLTTEPLAAALDSDGECSSGEDGTCALQALQRRVAAASEGDKKELEEKATETKAQASGDAKQWPSEDEWGDFITSLGGGDDDDDNDDLVKKGGKGGKGGHGPKYWYNQWRRHTDAWKDLSKKQRRHWRQEWRKHGVDVRTGAGDWDSHKSSGSGQTGSQNPWAGGGTGQTDSQNPWAGGGTGQTDSQNPWAGGGTGQTDSQNPWAGGTGGNQWGNVDWSKVDWSDPNAWSQAFR